MATPTRASLRFRIGRKSDPIPLYYRLETILRAAIDSGEYPAGESLPSEQEIGKLYGVSRITVRRAVGSLVDDGLLKRERGRSGGTFVIEKAEKRASSPIGSLDRMPTTSQIDAIRVLAFDIRPCDAETAALLGVEANETIRFIERVMSAQDEPIGYVRNYLPASIGEQLQRTDLDKRYLNHVLSQIYGVKLGKVHDEIEAHVADSRIAALLKVRAGAPVLRITRRFFGKNERCVYLTKLIVGGKYKMAVTLPLQVLRRRT